MRGVLPSSFAAIAIFFTASDGMSKILPAPVIPELEKGSQVSEEERAKLAHARGFALTYRGQLDRLAFERYVSNEQDKVALVQNELVISSTEERDETMFRFGQDWFFSGQPAASHIWDFVKRADRVEPKITYAALEQDATKFAGLPWHFSGRLLAVRPVATGVSGALMTVDGRSGQLVYVFSSFTFPTPSSRMLDVTGYLAGYLSVPSSGIHGPALAAFAVVRHHSIERVRTAHARDQRALLSKAARH